MERPENIKIFSNIVFLVTKWLYPGATKNSSPIYMIEKKKDEYENTKRLSRKSWLQRITQKFKFCVQTCDFQWFG